MKLNKEQIEFLNEYARGTWTFNEKTGLVDIKGDFNCSSKNLTDFKGVKFGVVTVNFTCSINKLTSLVGAPQEVGGYFGCSNNRLTSLEGAPQVVGGSFSCQNNKLTSLVGAPQKVGRDFDCSYNRLTSLEGAPQKVGRNFSCYDNKLTSLNGAPKKVGGDFEVANNRLTSLVGAPQKVGGDFYCHYNPISGKTLNLVWETMQEKKIDYWFALSLLRSEIKSKDWEKMSRGLDERLSKDAQKGISMLGRFGHFD